MAQQGLQLHKLKSEIFGFNVLNFYKNCRKYSWQPSGSSICCQKCWCYLSSWPECWPTCQSSPVSSELLSTIKVFIFFGDVDFYFFFQLDFWNFFHVDICQRSVKHMLSSLILATTSHHHNVGLSLHRIVEKIIAFTFKAHFGSYTWTIRLIHPFEPCDSLLNFRSRTPL